MRSQKGVLLVSGIVLGRAVDNIGGLLKMKPLLNRTYVLCLLEYRVYWGPACVSVPQRGIRPPGTGVKDIWELPYGC